MFEIVFAAIATVIVGKFAYDRGQNSILFGALIFISLFIGEFLAASHASKNSMVYVPLIYFGGLLGAMSIAFIVMSLPEEIRKR
jgi:hypothetical protein